MHVSCNLKFDMLQCVAINSCFSLLIQEIMLQFLQHPNCQQHKDLQALDTV